MIGWIIIEIVLIALSITSVALSLPPAVAFICMGAAMIPGFFIYQSTRNRRRKSYKIKSKTPHRFIQSRGKVLYFPDGGRRNGTHKD